MLNKDGFEVSDWQSGFPPYNGIWEILDGEYTYYARFKDGLWGGGQPFLSYIDTVAYFVPYNYNNDPANSIKWRGVIDDE